MMFTDSSWEGLGKKLRLSCFLPVRQGSYKAQVIRLPMSLTAEHLPCFWNTTFTIYCYQSLYWTVIVYLDVYDHSTTEVRRSKDCAF